jgi:diguanylate cyclase (GGDEF)-like protein
VNRYARIRLLVLGAVAIIAASVWLAGSRQRSAADRALDESEAASQMLVAMLDQESGLLGHVTTGDPRLLRRYQVAGLRFERAVATAEEGAPPGEADERAAIAKQRRLGRAWRTVGETLLITRRPGEGPVPVSVEQRLSGIMNRFRAVNGEFRRDLEAERDDNQAAATTLAVALILVLSLLFGTLGYVLFERRARREDRHRRLHSRFSEMLQLARSEEEAYGVVKEYLEQLMPGAGATVLNRNSSANRLEPRTPVASDSRLNLESVEPQACMAIRGGRTYERHSDTDDLMTCEVCGTLARDVTCVPSLVGGEVIGSLLVTRHEPLDAGARETLLRAVTQAAPVLANLRNLAIADHRAATDGLTGLANARSVRETLTRMVAQADRSGAPLAVVAIDLDHFKALNDRFGHQAGDEALAAVGAALTGAVRTSDFAGRWGGEEFLVLLPDTDVDGAAQVADKLHALIRSISIPAVPSGMTASLGVAALPRDATTADELVRAADRALYAAKAAGRDRVMVAGAGAATADSGPGRPSELP